MFVFAAVLSVVVFLLGLYLNLNLQLAVLFGAMIGFGFVYYLATLLLLVLLYVLLLSAKKYKYFVIGGFTLLLIASLSRYFNYLLFAAVLFPIYFGFGSFYYAKPRYFWLYSALFVIDAVFLTILIRAVV